MDNDIENVAEDGQGGEEGNPVCPRCLAPVDPENYYCPVCGEATGRVTPYVPFVNIPFNYAIFGRLWRKVWYEKAGLPMKAFSLFLILLYAPIMLIGLPFLLWEKLEGASWKKKADVNEEE